MNFHIHEFSKDRYRGEMSRQESPNIPRKRSRLSHEGRRGTPSSTETLSDQRQSSQRRRLSNESVNRSSRECAQNSAMDATFLDRLHINTPTPENVGNTSGQENMFGNFL
jgi:hypothetical protein